MPVEKLSISLPEGLARQLDELAEEDGVTRSSLVREATARYLASRASDAEAKRRRAGAERAVAGFDEVASLWGEDDRPGVEYLADVRGAAGTPHEPEGPAGG
jgi:predicted transcriptional regulator